MVNAVWDKDSGSVTQPSRVHYRPCSEIAAAGSAAPWTAARCNRLLRPLSSKIAALRKARLSKLESDEIFQDTSICSGLIVADASKSAKYAYGGVQPHPPNAIRKVPTYWSDEWTSSPRPAKKLKRTYSSKSRSQGVGGVYGNEDQVQLTQPRKEAGIEMPLDFTTTSWQANVVLSDQIERKSRALREVERSAMPGVIRRTASEQSRLIDGVHNGLVALMKATSKSSRSSVIGCCTLYSTCLRKIPAYIKDEEILSRMDDPTNDDDIASAVYNDLEQLGSLPGAGWNSLEEVVRAHGIGMVGEAIKEGTIRIAEARHLSSLCLAVGAYDAAQQILESMVKSGMSAEQHLAKDIRLFAREFQAIYTSMEEFALQTGRYGFLYRQTAAMLDAGILPLDWTSSRRMIPCWNGVIRSITQEDEHACSATVLLQKTISRWYKKTGKTQLPEVHDIRLGIRKASRRPELRSVATGQAYRATDTQSSFTHVLSSQFNGTDGGLDSTISSLLTVFLAINILEHSEAAMSDASRSRLTLHELGVEVRQALEIVSYDAGSQRAPTLLLERLRLPLLAAGMARIESKGSIEQICTLGSDEYAHLTLLPNSTQTCGQASIFFCEVAQCCATAKSGDALHFVKAIVNNLLAFSKAVPEDKATTKLCGQIALATAFEFSEATSQPDHLNWALEIELALSGAVNGRSQLTCERTPARSMSQNKSEYRWEEGICEWIAKTPSIVLSEPSDVQTDTRHDQIAVATPRPNLELPMRILSQLTPCAINKKLAKPVNWLSTVEIKSSSSHVEAGVSTHGDTDGLDGKRLAQSYQTRKYPQRKPSKLRPSRKIFADHQDDELDELSAPGSSQETSQENLSALSACRAFANVSRRLKRQMRTAPSRCCQPENDKHRPGAERRLILENSDTEDELALS